MDILEAEKINKYLPNELLSLNALVERGNSFFSSLSKFQFRTKKEAAVKQLVILGHKFQGTILTEPTYCSQCNNLIWGINGQSCKLCGLVSHRKCLWRISAGCSKNSIAASPNLNGHKLKQELFLKPTFCNHCGKLIADWKLVKLCITNGLECDPDDNGCGMTIHLGCEQKISKHCVGKELRSRQLLGCQSEEQPTTDDLLVFDDEVPSESYLRTSRISLDNFVPIRFLGRGSSGKTLLVRINNYSQREFAMKVVKKTNDIVACDPESIENEKKFLRDLGRESKFLRKLHCCFQTTDRLCFLMEYIRGQDLYYYIEKGKFTEARTRFYAAEIFLAVKFLHSKQIIHRDLKLDNIILDQSGHCKLIDFGYSKELTKALGFQTRTFCGTPSYMSPEILDNQPYDFPVDWWSFGVLIFEMLTGQSPFFGETNEETYERILKSDPFNRSMKSFIERSSPKALDLLVKLLEKKPQDRISQGLIEVHPFFEFGPDKRFLWDDIAEWRVNVPYLPSQQELDDSIEDSLALTPISLDRLDTIPVDTFDRFSNYCSESMSSLLDKSKTPQI